MSSHEIEDVLASIRRLVSDDLRPANRPGPAGPLLLTPALRVVASSDHGATSRPAKALLLQASQAAKPEKADDLDFEADARSGMDATRSPLSRSAMESAAEAFHDMDDEFILSLSDQGTVLVQPDAPVAAPSKPVLGQGHEAIFAVLTRADSAVRVPPVAALADAEGGAPVEDEAQWSVVDWAEDFAVPAPDATSPTLPPEPARDAAPRADKPVISLAGQGGGPDSAARPTLVLPFVSTRRPSARPARSEADPLILHRSQEVTVPIAADDLPEPPALDLEDVTGAARFSRDRVDAAVVEAELVTETQGLDAVKADAISGALDAPDVPAVQEVADVALADRPASPVAAEPLLAEAPVVAPEGDAHWVAGEPDHAEASTSDLRPADTTAAASDPEPVDNLFDDAEPVAADAGAEPEPPARQKHPRLADAAFTRWPGWAQSAKEDGPADPPALRADETRTGVTVLATGSAARRQDPDWADRAEAEIHRILAAELAEGVVTAPPARQLDLPVADLRVADLAAVGLPISEPALRNLVRSMIHEELSGKLGERITANVRTLVQMELQKTLSVQVTEFRSQRREPLPES